MGVHGNVCWKEEREGRKRRKERRDKRTWTLGSGIGTGMGEQKGKKGGVGNGTKEKRERIHAKSKRYLCTTQQQ